ncbi:MAG: hypothetical protein M3O67_04975 [Bacteroidota bacterium]|nr:hypothetical protein [Bacteroidota bacterium]
MKQLYCHPELGEGCHPERSKGNTAMGKKLDELVTTCDQMPSSQIIS